MQFNTRLRKKMSIISPHLEYRKIKLLENIDLKITSGYEIGPHANPLLKKDEADIKYIDYTDTVAIKKHAIKNNIDPNNVQHIDFNALNLTYKEIALSAGKRDFVIACHVIEHVPNLFGWLNDLVNLIHVNGTISLAIPDMRFTFDKFKHPSTLGEAIDALLNNYTVPSIRQVFEHCYESRKVNKNEVWLGDFKPESSEFYSGSELQALTFSYEQAKSLQHTQKYIDSHCWIFTPNSFLKLMLNAGKLGILKFYISEFHPIELGEFEFCCQLRPADPISDKYKITGSFEYALRKNESSIVENIIKKTSI